MFCLLTFIVSCAVVIGTSFGLPESRIVNGTNAKLGEIPCIVSVRSNKRHQCGGSILSSRFVLTAAHCVNSGATNMSIQYGVLKITEDDTNSIQVELITKHEEYNPDDGNINDVAIFQLASPIPFSQTVKPTILPVQDQAVPEGSEAVVAGWGINKSGGSIMKNLQRVDIYILPDSECEAAYPGMARRPYHVCAGVPEGGKGECNGDSGGPLAVNGVQFGIVSWSMKPCGTKGFLGVYVRVPHYINWIKKNSQI